MAEVRGGGESGDVRPELDEDLSEVSDFLHAIGQQIKLLREQAGLTQKQFAKEVGYTESLIGSVEQGKRTPQRELLEASERLLDGRGLLIAAADDIEKAKAKARVRHPEWFRNYATLEASALEHHDWSAYLAPGLLQTEEYARAVFRMRQPLLTEERVEIRVAARMARQEVLARWPRAVFSWVIDESVLNRRLGGPEVHRRQLERFLEIGETRGMTLQVMPMDRAENAGMDGSFILITPKGRPQTGYMEVQRNGRLITDAEEVRFLNVRYGTLRAQAHSPQESLSLIEKMLGER
ncbi:helix-turn-helix domain-containing protein [Kitasatospora purpeofusca]|uniref:helix-turn-helix domain-containing protein n=1 Tax=Kitasatospora purpeofusca TaxID=67352 RepID=UPI00225AC275|nr:helix-turn-helix transcriptional regulator [Kitasatospora purpeofusca]MCX4756646.1 helix-turn-helix transcriptional regulator [Kitasatospora purpeofusca]WSR35558.1 helix-turn-helix transcriptional regulator [Kitasatospora purpeofusca]